MGVSVYVGCGRVCESESGSEGEKARRVRLTDNQRLAVHGFYPREAATESLACNNDKDNASLTSISPVSIATLNP